MRGRIGWEEAFVAERLQIEDFGFQIKDERFSICNLQSPI
jgi:hypothetical protein